MIEKPGVSYVTHTEAVFASIGQRFGDEAGPIGSGRHFGMGLFGNSIDYKPAGENGGALFVVTRVDGPVRGRTLRYNWRKTDPALVAEAVLRMYDDLGKGHSHAC